MLVLTRHVGESIMIGDDVKITITKVAGQNIRVGIQAPRDTPVHRLEIYKKIKAGETEGGAT